MGLFDAIGSAIKNVATGIVKSPVGTALDAVSYSFTHPVAAAKAISTGTFKEAETKYFSQSLTKQTTDTVLSTIGYVGAIEGAGAVAAASKAGTLASSAASIAKSLIPKSLVGKAVAVAAAPAIVTAVVSHPIKTVEAGADIINFSKNVGTTISDPSIDNLKNLYKENPKLSIGTAAIVTTAAALATGNIISNIVNTVAVKENTKATIDSNSPILSPEKSSYIDNGSTTPQIIIQNIPPVATAAASAPAAEQTKTVVTKTSTKKKKKSSKAVKKKSKKKKKVTKKKSKKKKKR